MEAAIKQGEENILRMKQVLETQETISRDVFEQSLKSLESTLLEMSKSCLMDLSRCNEQFCNMSTSIAQTEAMLRVIKDQKGHKAIKAGKDCHEGTMTETANIETMVLPHMTVPKPGTYDMMQSMKVLNGIGRAAGEKKPLIRKRNPDDQSPWLWSKPQDFFVSKQNHGKTSFEQVYGMASGA